MEGGGKRRKERLSRLRFIHRLCAYASMGAHGWQKKRRCLEGSGLAAHGGEEKRKDEGEEK